jgi:CDP-diacylglycerol--glycerol-3-phosphate 3-phosphatidyltransferase
LLNIPNVLCAIRLLGAPFVVALAWADLPYACLVLIVFLFLTDGLDGKIARLMRIHSDFGARLDTVADVTFYFSVFIALLLLRPDLIRQESIWIGAAIGSYAINVSTGLIKYGRVPVYHSRMAKTSWFLMWVAVVTIFAGLSVWFCASP